MSLTRPSKVPLMAATPTFMTALYSPGPVSSSPSHPGMALARVFGSRKAAQTFSWGAGMSYEPSIFMGSLVGGGSALERADGGVHAPHAFADGLDPGGVGDAGVGVGAEVLAGDAGDARLFEEERADVHRSLEDTALPALPEETRDVGEGVEGALRGGTMHA